MGNLASLQQVLQQLTLHGALLELAMLLAALGLAYAGVWLVRGSARPRPSIWYGERIFDGVFFPTLALLIGLMARWGLKELLPISLVKLAIPILASLVLIRVSVQVLHTAFPSSSLVRRLERTVSWLVWAGLVLWLTGALPLLVEELGQVHWRIGGVDVSLLELVQGLLSAVVVLLLVLWFSAAIEARLLKDVIGSDISARKMAANGLRALLLGVGMLVALSAAGIPMSALSVMGGAIGVGVGLGLQKLAAN